MTNNDTPLEIIREKEVEFKKYLIKTQTQADKIVEDAKKEAEKLVEKLATDGEQKAAKHFDKELLKINKQAQEIRSEAPEKAKQARQTGLKNLDKTIAEVSNILMPKRKMSS